MTDTKFPFGKRYTNLQEIGQGGMGKIYKVYDTIRAEHLALKEMGRHYLDSPAARLRFKNEFRIMSQFQHPNIVRVFEFGLNRENIPFITMEFVEGRNLSELSQPSIEQVTDILIQVCQTLAVIHSRLYVHRDLKPDNIKLLENGSIKLLDYGLISQVGVQASAKISGTYYYLAPEVIVGGIIDESTDLYSLGIIGYELLTGTRPFSGRRKEILQGHLKQIPPEPAALRPDVPSSLNSIIMKLLEKDKSQRYRDSAAVLEDLQLVSGQKSLAETTAQKRGYLYSSKLVGRTKEIEYFKQRFQQLRPGHSVSLFIGAPAGAGKTRLLNEMKSLVELAGIPSLYLDSRQSGEQIYGWVNNLLQHIIPLSDERETLRYQRELGITSNESHYFLSGNGAITAEEIAASVVNWLVSITQRTPLVLFLDDLHRLDLKSLQVLNQLIRRKEELTALIIADFRNDEVEKTSPLWHTLNEGLSEYLELRPLNEGQTKTLIENLLYPTAVSSEFLSYSFNNCGGNIFDLLEFLQYMITKGWLTKSGNQWIEPVRLETLSLPKKLEERLRYRINNLGDQTRAIAGAGAVLEDKLNLENWQTVAGCEEDHFFQAIDDLMSRQIIIKVNGDYQFGHDLIRSALYQNLPETQKRSYHLQTAKFFEDKLVENNQALIPTVAHHFVAAGAGPKAIDYSLQAARAAERNQAEWEAFGHYRTAAHFLANAPTYPDRATLLLEIYEKAAQFSSAAWIDAATCLKWLQAAIDFYSQQQNIDQVFALSLAYIVTSAITSNYQAAREKILEVTQTCRVEEGTLLWATLYGAGVCLVDWYQGYQNDCFAHAGAAIDIFEKQLDTLPDEAWPVYSWALFWRDKARAYRGQPVDMDNIEKIRQLMVEGRSDKTIYWHTLTAVGARAAFSGRWADLLEWKQLASQLSQEMGKIYWFECWISHSYLYGALQHGKFSQLKSHIERVEASPDPYQVRLAYLFQGRLELIQGHYEEAEQNLTQFFQMEEENRDNSYPEGFVYLAKTYLESGAIDKARKYIDQGLQLTSAGKYENPFYRLQFRRLQAEAAIVEANYSQAEQYLAQSLELAETLDNPIQTGFIQKTWGALSLKQDNQEQAKERLGRAKEIFLSLDNKYQAGRVVTILESLSPPAERIAPPEKMGTDGSELSETEVEDKNEDKEIPTRADDEPVSYPQESTKKIPDAHTESEDMDLEETEAETE